jgi:hypothetical protein
MGSSLHEVRKCFSDLTYPLYPGFKLYAFIPSDSSLT